jgi:hypothetical protein
MITGWSEDKQIYENVLFSTPSHAASDSIKITLRVSEDTYVTAEITKRELAAVAKTFYVDNL